jgi:hypothetical protein
MKLFAALVMIFVGVACAFGQNYRKIPSEIVNEIASYDYAHNSEDLVSACLSICYPDSQMEKSDQAVLTPLVANIDGGAYPEVLALVGWEEEHTTLVVFKRIGDDWYLIFSHPVNVFYNPPELKLADNASPNKIFYVRQLYDRGTGVYKDTYEYFKLVNGKVRKCLEMVNDAHIYGWGQYLNQDVQTSVSFASSGEDMLWARFRYNFFPGAVLDSDVVWIGHPELPFVQGDQTVYYRWDSTNYYYVQKYPPVGDTRIGLTDAQVACFGNFGNDSLFVSAFNFDIHRRLENGTHEEKILLSKYLKLVRLNGRAYDSNGPFEQKTKLNGTGFYGPKKKK